MLYAILCYDSRTWSALEQGAGGCGRRGSAPCGASWPTRAGSAPSRGCCRRRARRPSEGPRGPGHRRPVRRRRAVARLRRRLPDARRGHRDGAARAPAPAGAYELRPISYSARAATLWPAQRQDGQGRRQGKETHGQDRHGRDGYGLDRRGPCRRPAAGHRCLAALFSRPRHRRGSVPGSVLAGPEDLARQRAAARSHGLAHFRRQERRHRRRAPPRQAGGASGGRGPFRPGRRRGRHGRAP